MSNPNYRPLPTAYCQLSTDNCRLSTVNKGFTLLEMVIAIMLLGIISGITATVINQSFRSVGRIQGRKTMLVQGSTSISKFSREFGQIINENSLLYADEKKIQFTIGQGVILEYELTGSYLARKIVGFGSSQVLTGGVDVATSNFSYFESNNLQLTTLPLTSADRKKVWMVELNLNLVGNGEVIVYLADVFPENLRIVPPESGTSSSLGGPPPPPPGFGF